MQDREWLAVQFEALRPRLQSVAYSILGSMTDAEDAVQESWLRLDRSDTASVADLQGWLTTVVGRISRVTGYPNRSSRSMTTARSTRCCSPTRLGLRSSSCWRR